MKVNPSTLLVLHIPSLLLCISHCLSPLLSDVLVSLSCCLMTPPHLLPSLSLPLLFLPPFVFQLLSQTMSWHNYLAVRFHEHIVSVLCLLRGLSAQRWASPSPLLLASWAYTAWSSRLKAMFYSLVPQDFLTGWGWIFCSSEMEFTSQSAKSIFPPFSLLHRSRN